MMRRLALMLATVLCLLIVASGNPGMAKESWTRTRSRNFVIVGNVGEGKLREVATRLEQFREAFARIFTAARFISPVPTTVIVFKSDNSYEPFKPLYQGRPAEVAGYFQPGRDVNYITLNAEKLGETPYGTIFHEYVHLMVDNNLRGAPAWFNEGMAEYYSAFEVTDDDRKATLGRVIKHHVQLLQRRSGAELLPLRRLLAVDHSSPYYNERDKKSMFYAQSWALVHYLVHADNGRRMPQLMRYINHLRAGASAEETFEQAFQTDLDTIERELKEYVRRFDSATKVVPFDKKLEFDKQVQSATLTEAEAQYYLGDLLLHTDRLEEAEARLGQALALDPALALADASLGMLRVKQRRFPQARIFLERAVRAQPESYLAHYYYAFALSRQAMDEAHTTSGYALAAGRTMQAELRKAIELAPGFPESYHLLAFVNLAMNERLDEAIALLNHALILSPGRPEFINVLAQVYLRQKNFKAARKALDPLIHQSADQQVREQAQALLKVVASFEAHASLTPSGENNRAGTTPEVAASTSEFEPDMTLRPARSVLRKRFNGERVRGVLTEIECTDAGVLLSVTTGERLLKLHSSALKRIIFLTYVPQIKGELTCGPRIPANSAIVTYRPLHKAGASEFDGEAVAIEFIPDEEFEMEP